MEENHLTTIHESMRNAAFARVSDESTVISVRVPVHVRDAVSDICKRNGTTLSGFLAQVCVDTLKDYVGAQDH